MRETAERLLLLLDLLDFDERSPPSLLLLPPSLLPLLPSLLLLLPLLSLLLLLLPLLPAPMLRLFETDGARLRSLSEPDSFASVTVGMAVMLER